MCGVFGLIQAPPFDFAELNSMSRLVRHRGPDGEGFALFGAGRSVSIFAGQDTRSSRPSDDGVSWVPHERLPDRGRSGGGGLALGHRRLSIIDLSANGHQPMCTGDERYWVSYNGEVYNYIELRDELRREGYRFQSDADTEVVLAAYRHWGADCLQRFNGMWALAIYDRATETLFLARDRFGVKPLYCWRSGNRLAFASEIKAFAGLNGWCPTANNEKLADFLLWSVLDHSAQTMFADVEQLPAGHYVHLRLSAVFAGGDAPDWNPQCWYRLPAMSDTISGQEAEESLFSCLYDAVRLRLRSDVPVGSCLSGGLDSSAIVCLMSENLGAMSSVDGRVRTFSARSNDAAFDEFEYARAVNEHTNADGHSVVPTSEGLFEDLDRLVWHQDEPFVSTSVFAQWCVFGKARASGVTVMLDGQGADETLGGYREYFGAHLAGLLRRGMVGEWWRETAALRREIGFSRVRSSGYTAAYLLPSLVGVLGRLDGRAYGERDWIASSAQAAFTADPLKAAGGRPRSVREMSTAQITATNLPMLLHWEDRNSMAHSIEARVPFLDYRVVEKCLAIADGDKVGRGISKKVLRRCMRGHVPDKVLARRDKMGFVTAEEMWARRDAPQRFRAALSEAVETLPGLLSPGLLRKFDEFSAGRRPFDHRYWRAISASRWVKLFGVRVAA